MTSAALLTALLTYGPTIIPMVAKLVADIKAGGTGKEVTPEDLTELLRLANQTSESIYLRLGITPPTKPAN